MKLRLCVAAFVSMLAIPALAADPQPGNGDLVKRGEYLARAGDCFACHTRQGGKPLAGGFEVQTPYGSIASPNITPDPDTGIGKWSDDDFYRVMHEGVDRDGDSLYPVMPFDHYTRVTRDDVMAIKAFLFAQAPVHAPRVPNHLSFPYNLRASVAAWRTLFFQAGTFQPDPKRSEAENRGAYLVEGLGHCGTCHTPRNIASGSKTSEALGGAEITGQGWYAPNITSDVREGIGGWTEQQLVDYLQKGVAPGRALVNGPMAEVIHSSLQYLTDADRHAIAAYLKIVPAKALYPQAHPVASGNRELPGEEAYLNNCAFCHQPDGRGLPGAVPALAGDGVVKAGGPENVIRVILGGQQANGEYAPMPGLSAELSSGQIAAIANYVRSAWGNAVPATATTEMVDNLGKVTQTMLAGSGPCAPVGPPAVTKALADPQIANLLRAVDPATLQQQVDAIVARLRATGVTAPQADLVNGLTAAYCPIATADGRPHVQQIRQLQRFAMLVYAQLAARDLPRDALAGPNSQGGNPAGGNPAGANPAGGAHTAQGGAANAASPQPPSGQN